MNSNRKAQLSRRPSWHIVALTELTSVDGGMRWDRGHVSKDVIDCRGRFLGMVICRNGDGGVNWEETKNQNR